VTLYAIYCVIIKISMTKYQLAVPEVVYYASFLLVGAFYPITLFYGQDVLRIPKKCQSTLVLRVISGFFSDVLLFVAFEYTTYSKAFCLFFTNTLMTPFLARYMLNEKIKKWDIIGIMFGFTGMVLLVQPWKSVARGTQSASGSVAGEAEYSFFRDFIGCLFGIAAALAAALALVYIRKLSKFDMHYSL